MKYAFFRVSNKVRELDNRSQLEEYQKQGKSAAGTPGSAGTGIKQPTPSATPKSGGSKSNKRDQAPAAPTTDRPPANPFTASSPRPDGVPKYNDNAYQLTPDKLNLPATKRRKGNQTPVTSDAAAKAVAATAASPPKPASPQATREENTFKCPVSGCVPGRKGFPDLDALNRHKEEDHREKDPEDPLSFCLGEVRKALGLDEKGKMKERSPNMERGGSSQAMKFSASSQGRTPNIKAESSTPMSRVATNNQAATGAPPTPHGSDGKAGTPRPGLGKVLGGNASKEPLTPPPDLWAGTGLTPAELSAIFPTMEDLQSSLSVSSLTPASTLSSSKSEKNSPKTGEQVNADTGPEIRASDWLPASFFADTTQDVDVDGMFGDDDLLEMDWEAVFPSEATPEKEKGNRGVKRRFGTVDDPIFDEMLFSGQV
jgi:hypothetical protein